MSGPHWTEDFLEQITMGLVLTNHIPVTSVYLESNFQSLDRISKIETLSLPGLKNPAFTSAEYSDCFPHRSVFPCLVASPPPRPGGLYSLTSHFLNSKKPYIFGFNMSLLRKDINKHKHAIKLD